MGIIPQFPDSDNLMPRHVLFHRPFTHEPGEHKQQVSVFQSYLPVAQRIAFLNNFRKLGFSQTARVWPGVSTTTRPLPNSRE